MTGWVLRVLGGFQIGWVMADLLRAEMYGTFALALVGSACTVVALAVRD